MLALLCFKHENGILQEQICKTNNKQKASKGPGHYSATANCWDSAGVRDGHLSWGHWAAERVGGGRLEG